MNTKKLLLLLVAMTMVFSLTALAAKAPATVTSKTVKLSGKFDKIAVSSGLEVDYTVNHSAPEAVISGLKEYVDRVEVKVSGGTLYVGFDNSGMRNVRINDKELDKIIINGPALSKADASSGAEIDIVSSMETDGGLSVNISSGAEFDMKGAQKCRSLIINASSGAEADIRSAVVTDKTHIDVSSGSDCSVDFLDMKHGALIINASSGAEADVKGMAGSAVLNASSAAEIKAGKLSAGTITANASSAASIKCSGRNVQKSESTLGSVKIVKEGR